MWIRWICKASTLLLLGAVQAAWAASLDFGRMSPNEVAVYVEDLQGGQVLIEHRADVSMNPASTMKLVTTFAALRALGSDYRWRSEWKSAAPVHDGALQGNLYWPGSGSPTYDQSDIEAMQAQLREQGINRIDGQVVLDRSIWDGSGGAGGFFRTTRANCLQPRQTRTWWLIRWCGPRQA